jgi:N-acetylmuramoyl-L-alanine amidase
MPMLTWLADTLRAAGLRVIETPGWQNRSHGPMSDVRGVLCHHTAGGGNSDWVIVRDGRAGLPGPLAHLVLEKDGSFRVIAAGKCWHAGPADSSSIASRVACTTQNGNEHMIGIEGVSAGTAWTAAQREAYPRGVAALLRHEGLGADRCIGHKEWAPRRKVDPGNWNMNEFRSDVVRHLGGSGGGAAPSSSSRAQQYLLLGD